MTASVKEREILGKLISLSAPNKLPENFMENHERIWEAFNLGREYEKEVLNKWLKDQSEKE